MNISFLKISNIFYDIPGYYFYMCISTISQLKNQIRLTLFLFSIYWFVLK